MRLIVRRFLGTASLIGLTIGAGACASPPTAAVVTPTTVEMEPPIAASQTLSDLALAAVDGNEAERATARRSLRSKGQAGLDALASVYDSERTQLLDGETSSRLAAVREAFEQVAQQRDAHASLLFWHTDLNEAKAQAAARRLPILSLRLLGQLDEELTCANSRFFRIALYANDDVRRYLRKHYVLHWSSERPVPKVTIDMGDGRELVRTLTGNSIHYVLDKDGRPLDALPGLYGPKAFKRGLENASELATDLRQHPTERSDILARYHRDAADRLANAWATELAANGGAVPVLMPRTSNNPQPTAAVAVPTAMPKAIVEAPLVQAMQIGDVVPLPTPTDEDAWEALIKQHLADAVLDEASRRLIRAKSSHASNTLDIQVDKFERMIAEDTVRNEYAMHRTLHQWLALSPAPSELGSFNQRVYAELFLTPRADPWLGLAPRDAYTAIEADGVRGAPVEAPAQSTTQTMAIQSAH